MLLSRHILAINDRLAGLLAEVQKLKAERHLPTKSPADAAIIDLKIAAIRLRREILKLSHRDF